MIRFENDFVGGTHPNILQKLIETNDEMTSGYGTDEHCERARELIKKACQQENSDVYFIPGGTLTNKIAISAILRPHQGVISPITGHIACHEAGAIEARGHKVLTLPSDNGKITACQIEEMLDAHHNDSAYMHYVQPGMVYLSHSTENGTTYTKEELTKISKLCREREIPLFIDGARLGYGLADPNCDLTLADVAELVDMFYIGGNKVGAFFGEAIVITNDNLKKDFIYYIKQNGALFAKGRLLGIQFGTLFEDGLYEKISKHAVEQGLRIRQAFTEHGFSLYYDSTTNLQFPILPNDMIEKLLETYSFAEWKKVDDDHTVARFCTSWSTKKENVDLLVESIKQFA